MASITEPGDYLFCDSLFMQLSIKSDRWSVEISRN